MSSPAYSQAMEFLDQHWIKTKRGDYVSKQDLKDDQETTFEDMLAQMKLKKTVEDLQRAHQVAQEQQEYRHKDKLQSMEHAHTTQMKNLRRRNDEKMDKLAVAMQKKP